MQFNLDKNKQAVQVIFSQIKEAIAHPPMFFSGSEVVVKTEHKHLGMILDSKLSFQGHVREAIIKARKGIGIICFLSKYYHGMSSSENDDVIKYVIILLSNRDTF